jgi:hypothetical protein
MRATCPAHLSIEFLVAWFYVTYIAFKLKSEFHWPSFIKRLRHESLRDKRKKETTCILIVLWYYLWFLLLFSEGNELKYDLNVFVSYSGFIFYNSEMPPFVINIDVFPFPPQRRRKLFERLASSESGGKCAKKMLHNKNYESKEVIILIFVWWKYWNINVGHCQLYMARYRIPDIVRISPMRVDTARLTAQYFSIVPCTRNIDHSILEGHCLFIIQCHVAETKTRVRKQ